MNFAQEVAALPGVGAAQVKRLQRLRIHTVGDLLLHLPLRYQDRSRLLPIAALRPGAEALIQGVIAGVEMRGGRRPALVCRIGDASGALTLRFFHFTPAQCHALRVGTTLRCFGEARAQPNGGLTMLHPQCQFLDAEAAQRPPPPTLTPIYPTTAGVAQFALRRLIDQALLRLSDDSVDPDPLPEEIATPLRLLPLRTALHAIHHPPATTAEGCAATQGEEAAQTTPVATVDEARRRLAFEELLAHHLSLRQLRERRRAATAPPLRAAGALQQRFAQGLPFQLTDAQRRAIAEIRADLEGERPMQRLLQGDVGAGKTVVIAHAVLQAVEAGYQAAVMAPTELLAEQHLGLFQRWLTPLAVRVGGLTGAVKGKARAEMLRRIADGACDVVVGTHALFQGEVAFHQFGRRLGLAVIDEQHRFGVHQRVALRDKGVAPHQLTLTATPIPRTLAMTFYADLDLSTIDELPPGRPPVVTTLLPEGRRDALIPRLGKMCRAGRQAYWVCPLIEESETLQCQAATRVADELAERLPGLRIGLLHGRLKPTEKEERMAAFLAGSVDILVATTVVEVGVDAPNASVMVVENAERLGLAQIHQLRGRVGRGARESHCLLLYRPPLSAKARKRLEWLRETRDGFEIARRDLEMRGPGELLGARQTGEIVLRAADLARDRLLIPQVEQTAKRLLRDHPQRVAPLIARWRHQPERLGTV